MTSLSMTAREDYKKLAKKYSLPKLEDVERIFGCKVEADSTTVLHDVKKSILDMIANAQDTLEPIIFISEGSTPTEFFEARILGKRKGEYFELYKKLLEIRWLSLQAYFEGDEEKMAEFVKTSFKAWVTDFKPKMVELTKIMEAGWKKYEEEKEEYQPYLG